MCMGDESRPGCFAPYKKLRYQMKRRLDETHCRCRELKIYFPLRDSKAETPSPSKSQYRLRHPGPQGLYK